MTAGPHKRDQPAPERVTIVGLPIDEMSSEEIESWFPILRALMAKLSQQAAVIEVESAKTAKQLAAMWSHRARAEGGFADKPSELVRKPYPHHYEGRQG